LSELYDIIIIGAGAAGMAAGLYSARGRMKTLMLERLAVGGQLALTEYIDDYPGYADGISAIDLSNAMEAQTKRFGLESTYKEAITVELEGRVKLIHTDDITYQAKAVIIATGGYPARIGVPGEEELQGRGVSYCAVCDGAFFQNVPLAVVGGGDSAVEESDFLTRYGSKVTLIHRRNELRAARILQEHVFANPKIEILWDTVVDEIEGEEGVTGLTLRNVKDNSTTKLPVEGIFIFVGYKPHTAFLDGALDLNDGGYIVTNEEMETNIPGVYAAGDVRAKSLKQITTSVADGSIAALNADKYIKEHWSETGLRAAEAKARL
jgi:thioredoxin reductase (NADPH)